MAQRQIDQFTEKITIKGKLHIHYFCGQELFFFIIIFYLNLDPVAKGNKFEHQQIVMSNRETILQSK